MPIEPSTSPAFMRFANILFQALLDAGETEFLGPRGNSERPMVIRKTTRARSEAQKQVIEAVKVGLMRRNKNGSFAGLDVRVKAKLRIAAKKRKAALFLPVTEIRRRQREYLTKISRR